MTERKPPGMTMAGWVERQIQEAQKRGEFDDLPGAGKPIEGLRGPRDEMWWLKDKLRRENLDLAPPTIVARRKVEVWLEGYLDVQTEAGIRRQAEALNVEIEAANRTDLGPLQPQKHLDVESVCARWREMRAQPD